MQKQVSKQSLAIVALSILLAIAMGLTATFAAFQATRQATATINFFDGFSVTQTGWASDANNTQEFTATVTYAGGDATIAWTGIGSYVINDIDEGEIIKFSFSLGNNITGASSGQQAIIANIASIVSGKTANTNYYVNSTDATSGTYEIGLEDIVTLGDEIDEDDLTTLVASISSITFNLNVTFELVKSATGLTHWTNA